MIELESRKTTKILKKGEQSVRDLGKYFFFLNKDLAFPLSQFHEKRRRRIRLKITQEIMAKNLASLPRDETPQT